MKVAIAIEALAKAIPKCWLAAIGGDMVRTTEATSGKHQWTGRIIAVFILAAAFGFAYNFGIGSNSNQILGADSGLVVEPSALNFGTIWEQDSFRLTLPLENQSPEPIEITDLTVSCSCISVSPPSIKLPPGAKSSLQLELDLSDPGARIPVRDFAVTVTPQIKGSVPFHPGWEVNGKVRSILGHIPEIIELDSDCVLGKPYASTIVRLGNYVDLAKCEAVCEPPLAQVEVSRGTDNELGDYRVKLTPNKDVPLGRFKFDLKIRVITASGEHEVNRRISVKGRVVDDIRLSPASVLFGGKEIGQTGSEVVRMEIGKDLIIEKIEQAGDGLAIVGEPTKTGPSISLVIQQRFVQPGNQVNEVSIWLRRTSSTKARKTSIPVCYYGLRKGLATPGKKTP